MFSACFIFRMIRHYWNLFVLSWKIKLGIQFIVCVFHWIFIELSKVFLTIVSIMSHVLTQSYFKNVLLENSWRHTFYLWRHNRNFITWLNYPVHVIMWLKICNFVISIREVISYERKKFFDECSGFKFNNSEAILGMLYGKNYFFWQKK